jgi:predicted transcriptional regulator
VKRLKKTLIFENRRNHFQVLSDILEFCKLPQAKTCILRNSNTSFKLLELYLLQLQSSNLLELQPKTKKYLTTAEGQRFIDAWLYLKALLYPQERPSLTKHEKCVVRKNQLIALPANSVNQPIRNV